MKSIWHIKETVYKVLLEEENWTRDQLTIHLVNNRGIGVNTFLTVDSKIPKSVPNPSPNDPTNLTNPNHILLSIVTVVSP